MHHLGNKHHFEGQQKLLTYSQQSHISAQTQLNESEGLLRRQSNPHTVLYLPLHSVIIIEEFAIVHLLFLHKTGSNNPTGISSDIDKIPFHPCYTIKDLLRALFLVLVLMILVLFSADLLKTQVTTLQQTLSIHLPHEARMILPICICDPRPIPNKLGRVLALIFSILILVLIPLLHTSKP